VSQSPRRGVAAPLSIATLGRLFQYRIMVEPGHRVVAQGPMLMCAIRPPAGLRLCSPGSRWLVMLHVAKAMTVMGGGRRVFTPERQLTEGLGTGTRASRTDAAQSYPRMVRVALLVPLPRSSPKLALPS
jgi:hypothetical protein